MRNLIPSRGAIATAIVFEVVRPIVAEDLLALATSGSELVGAPPIQKLRARHHSAARLVAEGVPDFEIAIRTGYSIQRVRDLKVDPSFAELVAYYHDNRSDAEIEDANRARATLLDIGELALESILTKLEENPESIPIAERRALAQLAMDRTVAPPKSAPPASNTPTNITFNIGSRDLRKAVPVQVVEGEAEEVGETSE